VRFLISGYYGFGNLGDDALLQIIISQLKTRYPHATIDVLSAEPERTAHDYGIVATPRWDQAAIRSAVASCDLLLSGGGGLLQNATSLKSLFYYAGIVRTAIRAGKKAMVFAQSVGPLDFLGKQTVRECCRGLDAATVRDAASKALFAPLVPGTRIEVTADRSSSTIPSSRSISSRPGSAMKAIRSCSSASARRRIRATASPR